MPVPAPVDYEHNRGNLEVAIADFTEGIELSKQLDDERFLDSKWGLPAPGGGRFRRCMRECMGREGCSY